jgi:hypothetical protein
MHINRTTILVIFCISGWLPSPSYASWQNTRWDMSLEELFAVREHLVPTTPLEQRNEKMATLGTPLAKEDYFTPQYGFNVYLYFLQSRLTGVRLDAKENEKATEIFDDYKLAYGTPAEGVDRTTSGCRDIRGSWRDEQNGNAIMFSSFTCDGAHDRKLNVVRVLYQPIQTSPLKRNPNAIKPPIP